MDKRIQVSVLLLLQVLLFFSCKESDSQSAESLIEKFKEKSINKNNLDWQAFDRRVRDSFKISKKSGIIEALTLNNNRHSVYYLNGTILKGNYQNSLEDTCYLMGYVKREKFKGVGYIRVSKFSPIPNDVKETKVRSINYINEILDSIKSQDKFNLKAWVIDLRFNYGGDMWPMLIALSPFFKDGEIGYFKSEELNQTWRKSAHKIFLDNANQNERVFNSEVNYKVKNANVKIAVLISKSTQSAGEATAIALKVLPNVKFFGRPTQGLATSNQQIRMGRDEFLVLTTGFMADYKAQKYPEGIKPDYLICSNQELEKNLISWINQN